MTDTSAQSGIFWGIGVLWELGHFDKHQPPTRERKGQHFSPGNYYKNFILNEKFYQQMTTIRAFFLQIRTLFPIFERGQGRPPPSSYAPAGNFKYKFKKSDKCKIKEE